MLAAQDGPAPFVSLGDRVRNHADRTPHERAFECNGRSIDYATLSARAEACAAKLQAHGHNAGGDRRVGILANNDLDYAVVVIACQFAGLTVVPLPGLITADAQARMLRDANVCTLFHDSDHADKAAKAAQAAGGIPSVLIGVSAFTSGSALDGWLADAPRFDPVAIQPGWASDIIYSSGTTGTPKGIVQSFAGRSEQNLSLARIGIVEGSNLLNTVGLYSNFGMVGLMLTLWWRGTFFAMRKFSADHCIHVLANERVDVCWLAPATLIRIVDHPGFRDAVQGKSYIKLCAGAPLAAAQKQEVLRIWSGTLYDLYGQAETGTIALLAAHAAPVDKLSSVGSLLPTAVVRIIDDDGRELPLGIEGEIVALTSTMMTGYHARGDASATIYWTDQDHRTFVKTGDIGKLDADGFLWLCDRKKDMIISGGFNVFPTDIERVFQDHPAVFEAAVVGFPSAKWGETPVAFVTIREGQRTDEAELEIWVNRRVASIQRVAAVRIVTSLPNGTMGKVLKRELRDQYAAVMGALP